MASRSGDGGPIAEISIGRCFLCGGTASELMAAGFDYEMQTCDNRWQFLRCIDCGLARLDPRPETSALPVIYPQDYYAYAMGKVSPFALKAKDWLDRKKFAGILRHGTRPRSYLDIGCGDGRYLRLMESLCGIARADLCGIELDARAVSGLEAEGYRAICARAEDCGGKLGAESFDLITIFNVIEHVADPVALMRDMHGWLAPGGLVAVETPDIGALDARIFAEGLWGGYHFPRHWTLFTRESLRRAAESAGLQVVAFAGQTGHSFWMYSLHHWLKYGSRGDGLEARGAAPWLAPCFDPLDRRGLPMLMFFTALDMVRRACGARTSSQLMIARKIALK